MVKKDYMDTRDNKIVGLKVVTMDEGDMPFTPIATIYSITGDHPKGIGLPSDLGEDGEICAHCVSYEELEYQVEQFKRRSIPSVKKELDNILKAMRNFSFSRN
jgi:hypothetical protein